MHRYALTVNKLFEKHGDAAIAADMSKYMRDQFPMYGIKRPLRNELQKKHIAKHGLPQPSELTIVLQDLWQFDQRESQLFGVDLVKRLYKHQSIDFIKVFEQLILNKSWWDTVDLLATTAGLFMQRYPELIPKIPNRWIASDDFWLQRSAILFQLKFKENTDWTLLKKYILHVAESKEFFLQKASGWALREYSKRFPDQVRDFIALHPLAKLTIREGSKYL